jgi:tRNA nucleotidyltransferase (CCA-adding enzyme)
MAVDKNYNLHDFYNGKKDLKNKIIRCNNEATFINDPLRILRAIRLAGKYNFNIDSKTKDLMMRDKNLLSNVSKERINSELSQILLCDNICSLIKDNLIIFLEIIPELREIIGFSQNNPYHIYDVFEHTLKVLENTPKILELRLAALFHDIGKSRCYSEDENKIGHFHKHEIISKELASTILKRLKYENKTIGFVCKLIEYHDYPITNSEKSLRKLLNKFNDDRIELLFTLKKADICGQNPQYINRLTELEENKQILLRLIQEGSCFSLKQLDINGFDLINIGITKGFVIGEILKEYLNKVIEGKIENKKEVLINDIKKNHISK